MSSAQQRVLNKKLSQIFRMRGLSLRPDAMQPLYDCLETDENWESTLQALLAAVQAGPLKDNAVDGASVRRALGQLETRSSCATELPLEVVDADAMTPLKFVTARKQFLPTAPGSLHGPAESKQTMFALRLQLLEQRLKRNVLFKPPALSHGVNQKEHIQLTHIDALLGRKGPRVVLGLLTEMEEGRFHLEDAHSAIPLDLSQAETHKGLFTRNSVVVMEGEVQPSGAFLVSTVGLPPYEARHESVAALGGLDLLYPAHNVDGGGGGGGAAAAAAALAPKAADEVEQNAMLIVLSDVWLDQPSVLEKLEVLFSGYEQVGSEELRCGPRAMRPRAAFFCFVLCGNFVSPLGAAANTKRSQLRALFARLAQLLAKRPTLAKHAHFVFVPGPDDASTTSPDVLPRAALPDAIAGDVLREVLANCHLTTNPARLSLCGQSVVIFREQLLSKMRRSCVLPPNEEESEDLNEHLVKSVLDQAHLCPLPPTELAVYWQYDHALWLHPSPDVLILADRHNQYQLPYEETLALNPGSFASDFAWQVYRPNKRMEAERSSLA
tara:strand:+ start:210 stop:1865 length:1656 start_codon:yes stop_codon:yes gene_type:complete